MKPTVPDVMPIDQVEPWLSTGLVTALRLHGVVSVGDLTARTRRSVVRLYGVGKIRMKWLEEVMVKNGLEFQPEPKSHCESCGHRLRSVKP